MWRGQLHSKQVLKASLIILPLTSRPGHVTQTADELEEMEGRGEALSGGWGIREYEAAREVIGSFQKSF